MRTFIQLSLSVSKVVLVIMHLVVFGPIVVPRRRRARRRTATIPRPGLEME